MPCCMGDASCQGGGSGVVNDVCGGACDEQC